MVLSLLRSFWLSQPCALSMFLSRFFGLLVEGLGKVEFFDFLNFSLFLVPPMSPNTSRYHYRLSHRFCSFWWCPTCSKRLSPTREYCHEPPTRRLLSMRECTNVVGFLCYCAKNKKTEFLWQIEKTKLFGGNAQNSKKTSRFEKHHKKLTLNPLFSLTHSLFP